MKKFTRKFSNEIVRRSLWLFRSFALSLIALLWAHPAVLAQTCAPPPGPVTFQAGVAEECYNADNLYKVDISVEDFVNVDSFKVVLNYDDAKFELLSAVSTGVFDANSETAGVMLHIDDSTPGKIIFSFEEPTTRGYLDPAQDPWIIANLEFVMVNFPNNSSIQLAGELAMDLEWDDASVLFYCVGGENFAQVPATSINWVDGMVKSTVEFTEITYTVEPEVGVCPDDLVTITITSPVEEGMMYSINGGINWSPTNVMNASPGNHTLQVKDADGCLSTKTTLNIGAPDYAEFTYLVEDEKCDINGAITFYPAKGSGEYKYYVVPDDDWDLWVFDALADGHIEVLDAYETTQSTGLPAGDYWIAINDAQGCLDNIIVGELMMSWWQTVTIDPADVFTFTLDSTAVHCFNGDDGTITVQITEGEETGPYKISVNGSIPVALSGTDTVLTNLEPGIYEIEISDPTCAISKSIEVENAEEIEFLVAYKDAECELTPDGWLWIESVNDENPAGYTNWDYIVWDGANNVVDTLAVGDTLKGLAPGNYQVWLYDPVWECKVEYVNPDGSGNTVPVFTDGVIVFDPVVIQPKCYGDPGKIGVTNVTRSCPSCVDEPEYVFTIVPDSSEWLPVDEMFAGLEPGDYTIYVKDASQEQLCMIPITVTITMPDPIVVMLDTVYQPTCVDGNDGWVKMYVEGGTPPYKYSVDERPNWENNPPFGLDEGEHLLRVMDAGGCEWDTTIMVPYLSPIEITASIEPIECFGEKQPISVVIDTFTHYDDETVYRYYANTTGAPFTEDDRFTPIEVETETKPATQFGAGTYYVMAKDPYGCVSQVDTVVLEDMPEFVPNIYKSQDATCFETWTGEAMIEVTGGKAPYEYTYANLPDKFEVPGAIINWLPFTPDSMWEAVELQKGEYWFVVRDACGETSEPTQLIIDGFDPIEIEPCALGEGITDVQCNGDSTGALVILPEAVSGGAPGYGVPDSKYLYTLWYMDDGPELVGEEFQESNEYAGLVAGSYKLYVYDSTDPDAIPPMCPPDSLEFDIVEPTPMEVEADVYHVSCAGAEDGEIRLHISGGVGGTWTWVGQADSARTDGYSYYVTINEITGEDYNYSLKLKDAQDTVVFQVMGGEFVVTVMDEFGCPLTLDTIEVLEPEPWVVDYELDEPSNCDVEDGVITVDAEGGFPFLCKEYSIDDGETWQDSPEFGGITYGESYTILVKNTVCPPNGGDVYYGVPQTVNEPCMGSVTVVVEPFNPFEFDTEVECVQCYGESNGVLSITNMTGGSGAYQVQLVGPFPVGEDLDPSDIGDAYDADNEDLWWPKDAEGDNWYTDEITFDTLAAGAYYIYVRDNSGFTLEACCRPERVVICEPDSLELVSVNLVSNVACAGDSTGAIVITATGGVEPYEYNFTRTTTFDDNYQYKGEESIDHSLWQLNDTISGLPVGAYIGWVKDANGCITGCEINGQGLPIDMHRVVIREADAIEVDSAYIIEPLCYGDSADVELWGVSGGSGDTYTFKLEGTTYNGIDTVYVFDPMPVGEEYYLLENILASDEDGYAVSLVTDAACEGSGDTIWVTQPDVFAVEAVINSGALCPGDDDVLIVLETTGGTAPFTYDIWKGEELIRENSSNVNHVVMVGDTYTIIATDALGCTATVVKEIPVPVEVDFIVKDVSCYGDELASIYVSVTQTTPGRNHMVRYTKVIPNEDPDWTEWMPFDQDTTMNSLLYGDESEWDGHYMFEVKDDGGCPAVSKFITFVPVQTQLMLTASAEGNVITASAFGGAVDSELNHHYQYAILSAGDDSSEVVWQEENTFMIDTYDDYVVWVRDYNWCVASDSITAGATIYTIPEIQGEGPATTVAEDEPVWVVGVVTGIAEGQGFFMQDDTVAWSGIWVATEETELLQIGDGVEVSGFVAEIDDVTTIVADAVNVTSTELEIVPVVLESPSAAIDEMYESVLTQVVKAGTSGMDTVTGQFEIFYELNDSVVVNKWLYEADPDSIIAEHFYNVTGIVNGKLDAYTMEPRMDEDIVDITKTTPAVITPQNVEFKVYPNPFRGHIYIDNYDKLTRVVFSNIAGQRVIDIEYPTREIRTDNLVSGVYVISLFTESGRVKTERIVKW